MLLDPEAPGSVLLLPTNLPQEQSITFGSLVLAEDWL